MSLVVKTGGSQAQQVCSEIKQLSSQCASYEFLEKLGNTLGAIFSILQSSSGRNAVAPLVFLRQKLLMILPTFSDQSGLLVLFNGLVEETANKLGACCFTLILAKKTLDRSVSEFAVTEWAHEIAKNGELATISDAKVLEFANAYSIPCKYESEIRALVPEQNSYPKVRLLWKKFRDPIREQIKEINSITSADSKLWMNSAKSEDELLRDEQFVAKDFYAVATEVAKSIGGEAHFGPDNVNITKSSKSIREKIERIKVETGADEAYAVGQIEDGVRGTISFKTPQELKAGVLTFARLLSEKGWDADFNNLWENENDYSGYLDIDVKIRIPLSSGGFIMAEIQFHLDDFYDGRSDCIVSRAHKVYEVLRMIPVKGKADVNLSFEELNEASRFFFTAALFQSAKKGASSLSMEEPSDPIAFSIC